MAKRRIKNTLTPQNNVENKVAPSKNIVHINFTKYQNWSKSCKIKEFTNYYENDRHLGNVFSSLVTKTFPFLQNNFSEILANRVPHCHLIKDDKEIVARNILEQLHNFEIGEDTELWQIGTVGGARVIGAISPDHNIYSFYPMMIDCNHLIYPDKNNNQRDFQKFKKTIK